MRLGRCARRFRRAHDVKRVWPARRVSETPMLAIEVGSTAMGLQAVSLRRVGSIAVSTTYGTGAIVRIGEKIALGLRRAERGSDVRRRATIFVITTILVGYVIGAAIAAAVDVTNRAWLVTPVITCATAARNSGNSSSPNQALRLSQAVVRQDGCGKGNSARAPNCRHAATVSPTLCAPRCHRSAAPPSSTVSRICGKVAITCARHVVAQIGGGGRSCPAAV